MWTLLASIFAASTLAQGTKYGNNHVQVNFDSQTVEQTAFPEPNATLISPAFLANASFSPGWANGTAGATSFDQLSTQWAIQKSDYRVTRINFTSATLIHGLAAKNPTWMSFRIADFNSEEGRPFPYVYLSGSVNSSSSGRESKKLRVWIQGSVHGNEPAGDEATLALLGALDANQTWASSFLEKMDIIVVPRYNPDGNSYFQRTLATNFDPNRDHTKLARQQTRDIKEWFNRVSPHIAIDMHEYSAGTRYGANYSNAADGMYSAAKNLNIHPNIRELSEKVFAPAINASLASKGLRGEPYMTASRSSPPRLEEAGTDAKIGRNAMGLSQCVTFLFETRGIGIASQSYKRRTLGGLQMILGVLETARDRAEEVQQTIEDAIKKFIQDKEPIIVTDYTQYSNRTWTMVDRRDGQVVQLPVTFASTTPATANLTRSRPEGYIIPRAWSDLAERLKVSGVEVKRIDHVFQGEVEVYNVTTSKLGRSYYEGTILNTVTTEALKREVNLPAGSFYVSSAQKNAGLAFVALEPENIDSYVSFGIVPMEVGDLYPIFRKI